MYTSCINKTKTHNPNDTGKQDFQCGSVGGHVHFQCS